MTLKAQMLQTSIFQNVTHAQISTVYSKLL